MRQLIGLFLCCFWANFAIAQTANPLFSPIQESAIQMGENAKRMVIPDESDLYTLDFEGLKTFLSAVPMEYTPEARAGATVIALPLAGGKFEKFAICESPIMQEGLQAKFPEIHTYSGISKEGTGNSVRFSISARGLKVCVFKRDMGIDYIEPYAQGNTAFYQVYDRKHFPASERLNLPMTVDMKGISKQYAQNEPLFAPETEDRGNPLELTKVKRYYFAVSTTSLFSIDHGGTLPLVMGAVVEYVNQLDGIYERDADMRLVLVDNNEELIYLDPNFDPFTGTLVTDWMEKNPLIVNSSLNGTIYDVGHVFARYLGGSAIGVAGGLTCEPSRARGCSAGYGSYGDYFVSVLAQELGHQMAGGHTWNRCGGGAGRQGNSAYEPGSASTIMSYAGACGSDNVQGNSDLYLHSGTSEEMVNYNIYSSCGTFITTDNNPPVISLPYTNGFYIPISTPFELNGSATDPDGDDLTYTWEEVDLGDEVPLGQAINNSPLFRVFPANNSTNRYFPRLANIIAGTNTNVELLPNYSRDLTFRFFVRDNRVNGGGIAWQNVEFKASAAAGPFVVQYPNTNTDIWRVGTYSEVRWDVANSDNAPVNCKKVNIRLSLDGGLTYPIMLSQGTDNDGTQYVLVPDNVTNTARIRVEAGDGNVFFDISNKNFQILQPVVAGASMSVENEIAQLCLPQTFSTPIQTAAVLGFNQLMHFEVEGGVPPGGVAGFTNAPIPAGSATTFTLDCSNTTVEGVFDVKIKGWAETTTDTFHRIIKITTVSNDFSALALSTPVDGTSGVVQSPQFTWAAVADANKYDIQIASNPAFNPADIVAEKVNLTGSSYTVPFLLEKGKVYYWRIRPTNECGAGPWTVSNSFATLIENCAIVTSPDVPKNIPAGNVGTVETKITIPSGNVITDLNIKRLKGFHDWFSDLEVKLVGPTGTTVTIFEDKCGNTSAYFDFSVDDAALYNFPCPPINNGNAVKPGQPLTAFVGQSASGTWTLKIRDQVAGSGGVLEDFKMEFCSGASVNPPVLINNVTMPVISGNNRIITPDFLQVTDPDSGPTALLFTVITEPHGGEVRNNGSALHIGDHFTQQDINDGNIRFYDYGQNPGVEDGFFFTVTDGQGGYIGTPFFKIVIAPVATFEPESANQLSLYPNPAQESTYLVLQKNAGADMPFSVLDATGKTVLTGIFPKNAATMKVETAKLPEGAYFILLFDGQQTLSQKLVLARP